MFWLYTKFYTEWNKTLISIMSKFGKSKYEELYKKVEKEDNSRTHDDST